MADIVTRIEQARGYLVSDRGKTTFCAAYLGYREWMELMTDAEYLLQNVGRSSRGCTRVSGVAVFRVVALSHFNVAEIAPMI
jgi:hypothetical protein